MCCCFSNSLTPRRKAVQLSDARVVHVSDYDFNSKSLGRMMVGSAAVESAACILLLSRSKKSPNY